MRRTTSLTALLLGATLLAPTGAATAVGETCRGEAATIVGTPRTPLQGTDGRDVVVTNAASAVSAGAGDDLICVTKDNIAFQNFVSVDAGPGNDVVDTTAALAGDHSTAALGDGSDTLVGGAGSDVVMAGPGQGSDPHAEVPSEAERDVIETGDGSDYVTSGGPGLANDDVVRAGNGDDVVMWSGVMGAQSVLDAGADSDLLIVRASGQTFGIDLTAQTLTRNGVREATFSSFERLRVAPEPGLGTLQVLGTVGDDVVQIDGSATLHADLGEGDDSLELLGTTPLSAIDLGAGQDFLRIRSQDGSVDLDLAAERLVVDDTASASVTGIENAAVSARDAAVTGDGLANSFSVYGCRATVDGRGRRDTIVHQNFDPTADEGFGCSSGRTTLRGGSGNDEIKGGVRADRIYGGSGRDRLETAGARQGVNKAWGGPGADDIIGGGDTDLIFGGSGNDRMVGSKGKDTLVGAKGRDKATGGPDRDTCVAEVTKACER